MKITDNLRLIVVEPKSRKDIEELANFMRQRLGIDEKEYFVDVLKILEFDLAKLFDDDEITYSVPDEWTHSSEEYAYYDVKKRIIFIRSDVYDNAVRGDGMARFTIMHEIAHYILFGFYGKPYSIPLSDIEHISDATLHAKDPEWQADTFSGAFLCKKELVRFMEAEEIQEKCGVSLSAAKVAYKVSRNISYKESIKFENASYTAN